jgi:hypothetical protein
MAKRRWSVNGAVVGGKHIGVYEAETGADAIEMARGDASVSLCHHCADECEDPEVERLVATCGDEEVEDEPREPDTSWQEKALAAGWTPPKADPWTVKRHSGNGSPDDDGLWKERFAGEEDKAREKYAKIKEAMRQGGVRLIRPDGTIALEQHEPRLMKRW